MPVIDTFIVGHDLCYLYDDVYTLHLLYNWKLNITMTANVTFFLTSYRLNWIIQKWKTQYNSVCSRYIELFKILMQQCFYVALKLWRQIAMWICILLSRISNFLNSYGANHYNWLSVLVLRTHWNYSPIIIIELNYDLHMICASLVLIEIC